MNRYLHVVFSHVLSLVFQPHPAFFVFGVEADAFRRLDYLGPAADPRHMWNRSSNPLINGDKWSNLHPKWCHNAYIYSNLSMLVPCLWVGRNELLQSHWSLMARISLRRLARLAVTRSCQKLKFENSEIPAMCRQSCFKTEVPTWGIPYPSLPQNRNWTVALSACLWRLRQSDEMQAGPECHLCFLQSKDGCHRLPFKVHCHRLDEVGVILRIIGHPILGHTHISRKLQNQNCQTFIFRQKP
jgi:hypothetical protein